MNVEALLGSNLKDNWHTKHTTASPHNLFHSQVVEGLFFLGFMLCEDMRKPIFLKSGKCQQKTTAAKLLYCSSPARVYKRYQ